jgi:hypothetical protein
MSRIVVIKPTETVTYDMPHYIYLIIQDLLQLARVLYRRKVSLQEVIEMLPSSIKQMITSKVRPKRAKYKVPAMIWLYEKLIGHKELLNTVWCPGKSRQEREIKTWKWN